MYIKIGKSIQQKKHSNRCWGWRIAVGTRTTTRPRTSIMTRTAAYEAWLGNHIILAQKTLIGRPNDHVFNVIYPSTVIPTRYSPDVWFFTIYPSLLAGMKGGESTFSRHLQVHRMQSFTFATAVGTPHLHLSVKRIQRRFNMVVN